MPTYVPEDDAANTAMKFGQRLAIATLVLLALTLIFTFTADLGGTRDPCDFYLEKKVDKEKAELDKAENLATSDGKTPLTAMTVIGVNPDKVWLGGKICVALGAPDADKLAKKELHLYLDNLEFKKVIGRISGHDQHLAMFDLSRSSDDAAAWSKTIGQLGTGSVNLKVGAGFAGEGQLPEADYGMLTLRILEPKAFWSGMLAFLVAIASLVFFAKATGILRDGDVGTTYSLARVQMAVWLYLVTGSFLYIFLVTLEFNGIVTPQALILLGISGTTGLAAVAISNNSNTPPPVATGGFFNDLLRENGEISLHRLQMLVWTAILGLVFLIEVYHSFRLPDFDNNLLVLMGISGATYLGFKYQEANKS